MFDTQKITDNLNRLTNDKSDALKRLKIMEAELAEIYTKCALCELPEASEVFKEMAEVLREQVKMLAQWIKEFDIELLRVKNAIDGLNSEDIQHVREAFYIFVLSDVSFSIKNVALMLYDFDRIIDVIKRFNKNQSAI